MGPALGLALCLVLGGLGLTAAYADDGPSGHGSPGDPFGGQSIPPGPVYILTPGASPGTGLPATSDPDDVEKQIQEDIEKNRTASVTPGAPSGTPTSSGTPVTGSEEDVDGSPGTAGAADAVAEKTDADGSRTWVIVVGALLAIVVAGGAARVVQVRRRSA
ncbi:hypothetical protein [Marmoricola sp. OAE513]|uniref:hypothetical protein n=1 Tax=Marmoricola sp. OAE513 TaxID=2817894 RepID=UPI001AE60236